MFLQLQQWQQPKQPAGFPEMLAEHQHSTSSYILSLMVVWYPELQKNIVALSPTEAKYFSVTYTVKEPLATYILAKIPDHSTTPPSFLWQSVHYSHHKGWPVPCTHQTYWCATSFCLQSYQQWWHLCPIRPTANNVADISQSLWPLPRSSNLHP